MRVRTAAALLGGYVLGTRAGRQRYEQIVELARQGAERLAESRPEPEPEPEPEARASAAEQGVRARQLQAEPWPTGAVDDLDAYVDEPRPPYVDDVDDEEEVEVIEEETTVRRRSRDPIDEVIGLRDSREGR